MKAMPRVGRDPARNVFQVHAVAAAGAVAVRRQLRRAQVQLFVSRLGPCLMGMEACAGAHDRARQPATFGHAVRPIPPSHVKPFVRRGKTDSAEDPGRGAAAQADDRRRGDLNRRDPSRGCAAFRSGPGCPRRCCCSIGQGTFRCADCPGLPGRSARIRGAFGLVVPKGVHNIGRLVAEAEAADLPAQARMPLDLLVGQFADNRPRWRHRSKPGGRRRASTPSPPISAAPPRRRGRRAVCRRCPGSGRSRPVFRPPQCRTYRPSARPSPAVARTDGAIHWQPSRPGWA
jgi:transposase